MAQKAIIAGGLAAAATLAWWVLPQGEGAQSSPMVQKPVAVVEETRVEANGSLAPLLPYAQAPKALESASDRAEAAANAAGHTKTRTVVQNGKAILRGRVSGVLPEHFEDLQFSLKQKSTSEAERLTFHLSGLEEDLRGFASQGNARVESLPSVEAGRLSNLSIPHGRILQLPVWQQDLEAVRLQPDGTFEVDLTDVLPGNAESYVLHATHELYFDGEQEFSFGAGLSGRLEAGDRCEASCALTLEPAAIVAGKVERQGDTPMMITWVPPGTEQALSPSGESLAPQPDLHAQAKQNNPILYAGFESFDSDTTVSPGAYLLDLSTVASRVREIEGGVAYLTHSKVRVGLFRFGESEPLVEQVCEFGGEFRLRSPEAGDFLLVAMQDDYPILCQEVEVRFREVNQLEEPLAIAPSAELKGQVHDFGLLPEGGLGVRAERIGRKDAQPFQWGGFQLLVWDGREVHRASATSRTAAGGGFEFEGLSAGTYRVHLHHPEMQQIFSVEALQDSSCVVQTPTQQAFLSLPASVIEIRHEPRVLPGVENVEYEAKTWVLEVQDASEPMDQARSKGQFLLHEDETQPLLLEPNAEVRIVWIQNQGDPTQPEVKRELWAGHAGPMGSWDRVEVRLPFE